MPIVVSNEGWVKLPPKPRKASPRKPADPVGILRGPLAYITGRPDFKEPVKKQPIDQLVLASSYISPPPPPVFEEKPRRTRSRVPSAPVSSKSKHRSQTDTFEEADEEIPRPGLLPEDVQSQRSASPVGSRHTRAAPSVRSRRYETSRPDKPQYEVEDELRTRRSRRPQSVYDDEISYYKSNRSERSHRERERERDRDRYHSRAYSDHYAAPPMPHIQPIVIYSNPPPTTGCGGHHSCQNHGTVQHQHSMPYYRPMIEANSAFAPRPMPFAEPAGLPAPKPAPSEVGSTTKSSRSDMSYKWYTATQPLKM
ncbi:hypothetical protein LTR05_000081 [Lithohypha guttulata]|uniref:Uncharacterized protein n=1 Tax=Lithohypha guttulata TaxID=1690604 RepID=A0AAN7T5P9_9EURO|nr:hypothetical protein LTR05_000081 [Lithohypha guttulata]